MIAILMTMAASLGFSAVASAQQLPAICDEYPNLPVCVDDDTGGGNNPGTDNDDDVAPQAIGDSPAGGGGGAGTLPFTGYPLTNLLLLLLALLAAGLGIRGYLAARDRIAARQAE